MGEDTAARTSSTNTVNILIAVNGSRDEGLQQHKGFLSGRTSIEYSPVKIQRHFSQSTNGVQQLFHSVIIH